MSEASTRILGIDPGSRITGFGIVDYANSKASHVASGCIKVSGEGFPERLTHIFEAVSALVKTHAPHQLAIEQVFMHRNANSALKLGQARGAALIACSTRGLSVHEYSPNAIKQSVTGRGHADKVQVQHMIKVLLNLGESPSSDQADALAVALCHGHMQETEQRIANSTSAAAARLRQMR